MNLAIVGSRTFEQNEENLEYMVQKIGEIYDFDEIESVLSGGADGADALAEDFVDYLNEEGYDVEKDIYLPAHVKYEHIDYRPNHYFERNAKIAENCDEMIAFWDGESTGTEDAIEQAELNNKPLSTVFIDE